MENRIITSNKQVKLEIELILNKKLFKTNIINRNTYENVQDELLKQIMKEMDNY